MATSRRLPILVFILLVAVAIPPVDAQLFSDGFESGNLSAWTNSSGTPTVEEDPHCGTYSVQINTNEYAYKDPGSSYNVLYVRLYIKLTTLPSNNEACPFLYLYDGGTWKAIIRFQKTTGVNRIYLQTGGGTEYAAFDFAADTWYCVEVVWDNVADHQKLWIGGTEYIDQTYETADTVSRIVAGSTSGIFTGADYNLDCVIADTSYIGPESEEGQDLTFTRAGNLLLHDSATAGLDLARTYGDLLALYASDSMNKEIGFRSTGTLALWASYTIGKEWGFTLGGPIHLWAHTRFGKELSFTATNILHLWSSTAASFEIAAAGLNEVFTLLATLRLHAAALPTFEVRTPVEHAFNLYAAIHLHDSLAVAKELGYMATATIRLWDSAAMTTQGVAQDLTFLLTETLHLIGHAAATMQTAALVLDAASIAGLALIIALVAVALIMVRRRD